jgi:cytoskeleton protein RodZ
MSSTPFGEHLKRERELRGVSLDEIAAATRIKTSFLEALENGRWDELPGGAFNRGFVRATAHFLGLDEDGMVAEYALETGGESQAKAPPQPSGAMPRDYRPALIAVSALLLSLIAAGWFVHHQIFVRRQKRAAAVMTLGTSSSAPAANASVASATAGSPDGNPAPPAAISPGKTISASANQPPAAPGSVAGLERPAPEPLKLRLETTKTARIQVTGDGKVLFKGRLHSDDPKNFEAHQGFEITSSEPGVVKLQLDGENIPSKETPGRHGNNTISISRKDLKPRPAAR